MLYVMVWCPKSFLLMNRTKQSKMPSALYLNPLFCTGNDAFNSVVLDTDSNDDTVHGEELIYATH